MGQRLVISFYNHDVKIANCYYHWSAYTSSAAVTTNSIINRIKALQYLEKDPVMLIVKALISSDAPDHRPGFNEESLKEIREIYPQYLEFCSFFTSISRSDGLISITPSEMKKLDKYAESTVGVYMDTGEVLFNVLFEYSEDELKSDFEDTYNEYERILNTKDNKNAIIEDLTGTVADLRSFYNGPFNNPLQCEFGLDLNYNNFPAFTSIMSGNSTYTNCPEVFIGPGNILYGTIEE